jgi:hypothetical protein
MAQVYAGLFHGERVAIKRVLLDGRWEVRQGKLQGVYEEVAFGRDVAKAIASGGAELGKHLCYCKAHRESFFQRTLAFYLGRHT